MALGTHPDVVPDSGRRLPTGCERSIDEAHPHLVRVPSGFISLKGMTAKRAEFGLA